MQITLYFTNGVIKMDINYDDLVDENFVDDTEQIRNIAKKTWLSGAAVQLAHLDNVKATNVYNFGISDPRDLKATNLRTRRLTPATAGGSLDPPPSATSQCSSMAWGSNSSIPDLVRQHNAEKVPLPKPTRPASAKYSNTRLRPPSGKKPRPQSAKEPTPDIVSEESKPGFGVKGARYDPSGRPPKGIPNTTTTGWVGPPAGLKYPDKPPPGSPWKIDFPEQPEVNEEEEGGVMLGAEREVPPPPCTTPMPPTPEPDKPKRIFELYIGDPYNVEGQYEDDDLYENSDEELAFINYDDTDIVEPTANQNKNSNHHTDNSTNQSSRHPHFVGSSASLTNQNDSHVHHSESMANQKAAGSASSAPSFEKESMRLDLPTADDDYDEIDEVDTDRLLAEAQSVSEKFDLKSIININKHLPDTSSHDTEPVTLVNSEYNCETQSDDDADIASRKRAEDLVSNIINENGLSFVAKNDKAERAEASKPSNNNKSEIQRKPFLDHEKSSVKFKEDVTTVDITPRNIGRKVEEIQGKKKTLAPKDSGFIDLIEVKNRMEPVMSSHKLDVSPRRSRPQSSGYQKPPLGKSKFSRPASSAGQSGQGKQHTDARKDRPTSPNHCLRNHSATPPRPRSGEPLNRAAKPVTTVTVDYGEDDSKDKAAKQKKKKKKYDDVVTMMETINLQDYDHVPVLDVHDTDGVGENASEDTLESKCKSEPEKNYYEISRHSSMSHKDETDKVSQKVLHKSPVTTTAAHTVVKTTKTIEFDESNPREVTVKSVLDAQVVHKEQKEYKVRPPSRPPSIKPPLKKPAKADDRPSSPERPGSRLGFVAMAPSGNKENNKTKPPVRPSSTALHKRPVSASKPRPGSGKKPEDRPPSEKPSTTTQHPPLSEADKEEREKVIDNLLERTGLLDGAEKQEKSATPQLQIDHLKKKTRPSSAHIGTINRAKEQNHVRSAVSKRPVSASNSRTSHKHRVVSAPTGSRRSGKTRTIYTEPCIITTNTPYLDEESETEEDLACLEMHRKLKEKGLNIAPDTLQRALYPPSGRTRYYHISANLPQKSSTALLSHPREWLGEEYRRLQKAEKTLERANEIMIMQEKAEKRRAMLEGLTPEERKKLLKKKGKKGKKGAKKLRKSKSIA